MLAWSNAGPRSASLSWNADCLRTRDAVPFSLALTVRHQQKQAVKSLMKIQRRQTKGARIKLWSCWQQLILEGMRGSSVNFRLMWDVTQTDRQTQIGQNSEQKLDMNWHLKVDEIWLHASSRILQTSGRSKASML